MDKEGDPTVCIGGGVLMVEGIVDRDRDILSGMEMGFLERNYFWALSFNEDL